MEEDAVTTDSPESSDFPHSYQTANPIASHALADVLHLCDMETSADGENKRRRDALVHLLSATCETVLSEPMLRERLELDTAGDAGIVVNKKAAGTKFVKLKTRLYYKQQKFNLLREESEGYAKLIAELSQEENDFDVTYMLQVIRSLIGCFNLDPNRVMDILLEVFEMRIGMEKLFVDLIRQFLDNSTALTQVLAFKFNFYQVCPTGRRNRESSPSNLLPLCVRPIVFQPQERVTPNSLYLLAAILSHHKLINITELYCYVSGPPVTRGAGSPSLTEFRSRHSSPRRTSSSKIITSMSWKRQRKKPGLRSSFPPLRKRFRRRGLPMSKGFP